ncbi:cytochrome P450 [Blastococcus sp. PRF04-17]|uniref:cytochrome P450 n=1 Tax=Blastococcus sp. PRF04-17 TaxID=2933797 RepID=UPI001FF2175B|nr:cytochrome P450 [Blastococcus sp. PRF04-17]UOY03195.1 cytochrome P450 [Blastococcus sp. PRF04-17]
MTTGHDGDRPPAATCPRGSLTFDPLEPESFDSPHQVYERFRNECPVAHSDQFGGFWALFKYDDVVAMASDSSTYTTTVQNVVPKITFTGRRPPLHFDPPEHRSYRLPLSSPLRTAHTAVLEEPLREYARSLVAGFEERGSFDFSKEFALPFAAQAFALLLHLEQELVLRLRETTVEYNHQVQAMNHAEVRRLSFALYDVAREIVESRKANRLDPATDMVSSLLAATEDEKDPISEEMVVGTIRQMLVAALAAPHAVMGSAAVHLARDIALQQRLRADASLIPAAVEEFLRLYSPYRVFSRTPVRDVEIGGQHISEGEPIAMIFPSANRDADVFESPHQLRLDRPEKHIAFGVGVHKCPAAAFARTEIRIALEELLAGTTQFTLAGDVEMMNWLEFGPVSVPLAGPSPSLDR